jgi:CDP-diacylglycerol---glycerol-3-phosphate 3-phosphatidyltransferase
VTGEPDEPTGGGPPKKLRPLRDELTDLPNVITMARIALIPIVLVVYEQGGAVMSAVACGLFLLAAATDALDGYLARRMGLVTVVGKFLDPLADKLIVLSTLVVLVAHDRVPAWLVVVLLSRELAVTGLRAIASQEGLVIAAGTSGKIKTVLQLLGIAFTLLHFPWSLDLVGLTIDFHTVGLYLLYGSIFMSVLSAVEYFRFFAEAAARQARELAAQGITRASLKERALRRKAKLRALKQSPRGKKRAERKVRRPERKRGRGRGRDEES